MGEELALQVGVEALVAPALQPEGDGPDRDEGQADLPDLQGDRCSRQQQGEHRQRRREQRQHRGRLGGHRLRSELVDGLGEQTVEGVAVLGKAGIAGRRVVAAVGARHCLGSPGSPSRLPSTSGCARFST
jgi:hypothetical protein